MSEAEDSLLDLLEGVEKFAAEEIAKMKRSCNQNENNVLKKLNDIDKKISTTIQKMEVREKVIEASMHELSTEFSKIEVQQKVLSTSVNDINARMGSLEKVIEELTENIQGLDNKNKKVLHTVFTSALRALDGDHIPVTSTPIASHREKMKSLSPAVFYSTQDLDDLDISADNLELLRPFMTSPSKVDKLQPVQRAFFKYFLSRNTTDKASDVTTNRCIEEGVKFGVWQQDFCPEGISDFGSYLKERMKNERKYDKRQSFRKAQQKRLTSYVGSTLIGMGIDQIDEERDNVDMDCQEAGTS